MVRNCFCSKPFVKTLWTELRHTEQSSRVICDMNCSSQDSPPPPAGLWHLEWICLTEESITVENSPSSRSAVSWKHPNYLLLQAKGISLLSEDRHLKLVSSPVMINKSHSPPFPLLFCFGLFFCLGFLKGGVDWLIGVFFLFVFC